MGNYKFQSHTFLKADQLYKYESINSNILSNRLTALCTYIIFFSNFAYIALDDFTIFLWTIEK